MVGLFKLKTTSKLLKWQYDLLVPTDVIFSFSKNLTSLFISLTIVCSLLFSHHLFAMQPSIKIDTAVVNVKQAVTLTLSLDAENPEAPDFSVLNENFRILKKSNTSSISQSSDGILQLKKEWTLVLLPLKKGLLTIPSIKIGNESTTPISLQVKKIGQLRTQTAAPSTNDNKIIQGTTSAGGSFSIKKSSGSDGSLPADGSKSSSQQGKTTNNSTIKPVSNPKNIQDIIIKVSVNPQEAYVQSQIVLTQKIFHAVPLKSANLSTPVIKNNAADIIQLSEMKPYYWNMNGKRYHVIERNYAVFPKHSGSLIIESTHFSGEAKIQTLNEDDPFGIQTKTTLKKVTASAGGIIMAIKPQEEKNYSSTDWLPAKNITFNRKWSKPVNTLEPGESIVLQTTIIADGLRAEQLPEIYLPLASDIKTYSQPAELSNTLSQGGVTAVWQQKTTLIPSQAGELEIAELELPWWNVTTGQQEIAKVPQMTLLVKKAQTNSSNHSDSNTSPTQSSKTDSKQLASSANENTPVNWLYWLLPIVLIAGFILYQIWNKKTKTSKVTKNTNPTVNQQQLLSELKQACLDNNPQKVEPLLLHWAKYIADIHPATLEGILHSNQGYLQAEIKQLSQSLYSQSQTNWKGVSLWDAIKKYPYPDGAIISQPTNHLQKMYPS